MDARKQTELLRLIDQSCEDRCDDAVVERLDETLRSDAEAVSLFVRYRDMHASLRWATASQEEIGCRIDDGAPATPAKPKRSTSPSSGNPVRRYLRDAAVAFVTAAAVVGVVAVGNVSRFGDEPVPPGAATSAEAIATADPTVVAAPTAPRRKAVARITGLVDCQWRADGRPFRFGQAITSGQRIELTEGLVQLTFGRGAKVIVQGPASFLAHSPMHADLEHGKLAAVVPVQSRGYTVKTPTAEIVDLGTEFAVDVAPDGATEVHVLKGDVVARKRQPDGELAGEAMHVRKLDALRFISEIDAAEWITAQPDKFARQITPKLTREQLPALPVVDNLKLWMAADLLVTRDGESRVSAWRDVCVGDNQIGDDACQFEESAQPIWLADNGAGKAAVRFNGKSTRLTTDAFATGDQVTVFVACWPSAEPQNNVLWGGQFLNFGGKAPTIEMAIRHDGRVYAGLWAANAVGKQISTGAVDSDPIEGGVPHVFAYRYDLPGDRAEMWVDGQLSKSVSAWLSSAVNSRRTIGGHGNELNTKACYRGDIHEVLIYNAALDDADRQAVNDYLIERWLERE